MTAAKVVELALVTYTDHNSKQITQLVLVGNEKVHLLESSQFGISNTKTPQGPANDWLAKAIQATLRGKK